jgi:hypothetical protein
MLSVAVMLIGAFFAFYFLKIQTISNYKKYPPTTDCKSIAQMFNNDFKIKGDFYNYAVIDKEYT